MPHHRNSARFKSVYEQAATLPSEYLRCRFNSHRWGDDDDITYPDRKTVRYSCACDRCGAVRYRDFTRYGTRLGSGVKYPDNYVFDGTGTLSAEDNAIVRVAYFERTSNP
ncbi:hypothetical protein AB0O47_39935 [Streptomyces noursei]|uniref:hypothetical protein n=1 Tax=Streptomyces noursei TaxID=1971 RepID=UPI00344C50EA